MPITAIDLNTALIIIDLQKGIVGYPTVHTLEFVVEQAARLAACFREHGLPVVLVTATGRAPGRTERPASFGALPPGFADILPELNQQPDDILVEKRTPGAFTNTNLETFLRARAITGVVIVGVSTSNGVEATARQAFELGLNVTLAVDAMTDPNVHAHVNSVDRIFPKIAETGTVQAIIDHLNTRSA